MQTTWLDRLHMFFSTSRKRKEKKKKELVGFRTGQALNQIGDGVFFASFACFFTSSCLFERPYYHFLAIQGDGLLFFIVFILLCFTQVVGVLLGIETYPDWCPRRTGNNPSRIPVQRLHGTHRTPRYAAGWPAGDLTQDWRSGLTGEEPDWVWEPRSDVSLSSSRIFNLHISGATGHTSNRNAIFEQDTQVALQTVHENQERAD